MTVLAERMPQAMPKPYATVQGSQFLAYNAGKWITLLLHATVEGMLDGSMDAKQGCQNCER